ncbi:hypothetical protein [Kutzneria sp. NPDC052558]|uniref:hypothetical protein n=1 Tax=Kutzneria sp. NPDC052558 TaxID=3364121 RepID=UPI0037C84536
MRRQRNPIALVLIALLATVFLAAPAQASAIPAAPTISKSHWVYFGWPGEPTRLKSLAFPGGGLAPARRQAITYFVSQGSTTYYPNDNATDLRGQLGWSLADGYLPSPISTWPAGSAQVTVQHFANSVHGATAVFSRVTVTNRGATPLTMALNITAPATAERPLSGTPTRSDAASMAYDLSVPAGKSVAKDFVTLAAGATDLTKVGTFDANYQAMAKYWNDRLSHVAVPTSLPDPQLVNMFKATQITMWESVEVMPNGDAQQITSGGNQAGLYSYDAENDNDEIDILLQHLRIGDYATAASIMSSTAYESIPSTWQDRNQYLEAALKFTEPYELYLRLSGDKSFFTAARKDLIRSAAHQIQGYIVTDPADPHRGLIMKSNDFDNGSDYLINDEFAAIYGLTSYQNLATVFAKTDPSWAGEADWAKGVAAGINTALNNYLVAYTFPRVGEPHYYACLDACDKAAVYNGNYLSTTWLMSSLPWDGALTGNTLGGAWRDTFDATNYAAFTARDFQAPPIPPHSWGAWWNDAGGYGNTFNGGGGVQLLASSDTYLRTEAISNLEWLLANQSAPMQWGESFRNGSWTQPEADFNAYGLASTGKALLESNVSVTADGVAIIGRGVPTSWITSGKPVSWQGVPVGGNKTIDFTITPQGSNQVKLTVKGNAPVKFELPLFADNIVSATAGKVDNDTVSLPAGTTSTTVTVRTEAAPPLVVNSSTAGSIDVGRTGDNQAVGQSFFANSSPTVSGVKVNLRKVGTGQSDVTVSLQAMSAGLPSGIPLATATIPAASVGAGFTTVTAPLKYDGLVDGRNYAIVVGQQHNSPDAYYQWATTGSGGPLDMAAYNGSTWTSRSVQFGNAWLTLDVQGSLALSPDLSTDSTASYYFGQPTDQVSRGQLFVDTGITTLHDVRVKVRRAVGTGQSAMTVGLYATDNGKPTGKPLATATVPASQIGADDTLVDVPLAYSGMTPGATYAIVLGQQTPGDSLYGWTTSGSNGLFGFGKFQPDGSWQPESGLGDAWLQISGTLH